MKTKGESRYMPSLAHNHIIKGLNEERNYKYFLVTLHKLSQIQYFKPEMFLLKIYYIMFIPSTYFKQLCC